MSGSSTRARCCPACGALNASDFDRCIRCGVSLSGIAASTSGLTRAYDGQSLIATKIIAGLTLLVFAGQVMATMARGLGFPLLQGGTTADALHFGAIFTEPALVIAEPFRMLSAVFVHFGALHIGMNLLALAQLSRVVEPAVGSARYTIAYVTSGIASFAASTAYVFLSNGQPYPTAGASGAIFGIMGLILGMLWRRGDPRWKSFALQAVMFSIVLGFAVSGHGGIMVNNSAHIGGLACGILFGLAYAHPKRGGSDLVVNLGAIAAFAACVISLLLAHASPLWHAAERDTAARTSPVTAPSDPS